MFTTPSKPLASMNLQFLFESKSHIGLRMYRKVMLFLHSSFECVEIFILFLQPIFLRDLTIVPGHAEEATPEEGARFTLQNLDRKLYLASPGSADRTLWLKKLEEARKHCLATERSVMQRQRSSK